ncbi:MAG: GDP-mannose 4,6-dehydratase [Planctomycetota bacterium]
MAETILITGCAGFIGSHLAENLISHGYRVLGLDNFNTYYDPAIKRRNVAHLVDNRNVELVEGDIRDHDLVDRLCTKHKPGQIVHLAARAGVRPSLEDPRLYQSVNGMGTQVMLEAARRHGIDKVVLASSSSVYGNNRKLPFAEDDVLEGMVSPYAATKRANELMCYTYHHLFGISMTCLRFFTVYGPRQGPEMAIHKFTRMIDRGEPIPFFGDGTSRRDYTYIDDIIEGVTAAVERRFDYEIINLGESHTITLSELVSLIETALGKTAVLDRRPHQPGDVVATYADITKARKLLDYAPRTLPEEGVGRFVSWYRQQGPAETYTLGANP